MSQTAVADIGLIGLAVMGENLALNIADHGFKVAVYNRTTAVMTKFMARENPPGGLVACETVKELVAAVKRPRRTWPCVSRRRSAALIASSSVLNRSAISATVIGPLDSSQPRKISVTASSRAGDGAS